MAEPRHDGRWTVDHAEPFVVFHIGMRLNRPLRVRTWLPVFRAMRTMLTWLEAHPEAGLLRHELVLRGPREPIVLQYWRSFEDLRAFARDAEAPHLGPWAAFNRAVRDSGEVGIWHETFRVEAGAFETLFANMPPRGMGRVGTLRPLGTTAAGQTAAARLGIDPDDVAPVAPY